MKVAARIIIYTMLAISAGYAQDSTAANCQSYNNYVQQYNAAMDSRRYLPQSQINSKEKSYLIQACIISNKAQKIIGFKAGLISSSSQKRFYTSEPVLGVLTEDNLKSTKVVTLINNKTSLVEVELAFRLKRDINDLAELDKDPIELVDAIAPAIEIPLFHFKDVESLTSNDIIAANVGADVFILGDFAPISDVSVNLIEVVLTQDNEVIERSVNTNSKDRWEALRWLIKKSYLEGYALKKGTIYLTGSLIDPVIMKKLNYNASYTLLDDLMLTVK